MPKRSGEDWQRLGDYVIARRTALGMGSQPAFAAATGISIKTISQLDTGHSVRWSTVSKFEPVLGWKPGSGRKIVTGGEPDLVDLGADPRPPLVRGNWDDPHVQQLWGLDNLDAEERVRLVRGYLDILASKAGSKADRDARSGTA